jgi:hypothetical protein
MKSKECSIIDNDLGLLGQYIIYFFNRLPIRTKIIRQEIETNRKDDTFCYFGTWYVEGRKNRLRFRDPFDSELHSDLESLSKSFTLNQFLRKFKKKFQIKRKVIFTVCYCYEEGKVHFVSFIYDSDSKKLMHFDPGIHLYQEGQTVLVPSIVNGFVKANLIPKEKSDIEIGTQCARYIYNLKRENIAIQYNGQDKDAYCQTWTLAFLLKEIRKSTNNIEHFCTIIPENRSLYLYKEFIIPFLRKNKKYMEEIVKNMKEDYDYLLEFKTPKEYLELLDLKIKNCKEPNNGKYKFKKKKNKRKKMITK